MTLVTPVWNDAVRLEAFGLELAKALAASELSVRWIVSDDGSSLEEKRQLKTIVERFSSYYNAVELMFSEKRFRKGGAVYRAWDISSAESDWLAFVDADGAIDAQSTLCFLRAVLEKPNSAGMIGIRTGAGEFPLRRSLIRKWLAIGFRCLVRSICGLRYQDTQCGLKIISSPAYRSMAPRLLELGLVFDVELLVALKAQGFQVHEWPVPWVEVQGSKVQPLANTWPMLTGLLRIRRRFRRGFYKVR